MAGPAQHTPSGIAPGLSTSCKVAPLCMQPDAFKYRSSAARRRQSWAGGLPGEGSEGSAGAAGAAGTAGTSAAAFLPLCARAASEGVFGLLCRREARRSTPAAQRSAGSMGGRGGWAGRARAGALGTAGAPAGAHVQGTHHPQEARSRQSSSQAVSRTGNPPGRNQTQPPRQPGLPWRPVWPPPLPLLAGRLRQRPCRAGAPRAAAPAALRRRQPATPQAQAPQLPPPPCRRLPPFVRLRRQPGPPGRPPAPPGLPAARWLPC